VLLAGVQYAKNAAVGKHFAHVQLSAATPDGTFRTQNSTDITTDAWTGACNHTVCVIPFGKTVADWTSAMETRLRYTVAATR
jgi:hypothetical protein